VLTASNDYYEDKLSAERLKSVYEIATPRVQQYLNAEVAFVLEHVQPSDAVLELGCGYGRIMPALAEKAGRVVGIDTSEASLEMARGLLRGIRNWELMRMDAVVLEFADDTFDVVACIQNGISAFHVDQKQLVREAVRVCKPGGRALFSSYSDKFWEHRLKWFELQADEGLLGEIYYEKTRDGVIVCKDGFAATTVSADGFRALTAGTKANVEIVEVDESSLFCVIAP
jgi:2-polyprenyl-6-hydroxyphenyl methylase/3-demethylubiquinone-9 3-methyltransferase